MLGRTHQAPWKHPPEFPQLCASVTERSPQAIAAVEGKSHIIRYVNPAFCRLVGAQPASLVGRPFADAVPEGRNNACGDLFDRTFQNGTYEVLPEQQHGEVPGVYWSYTAWPILDRDSQPVGVMVQVTDTTETANFRSQALAMNQALLVSSIRQHELADQAATLSAELRETERLASLGTLATGIGHDLGNLLLPVRMRLDAMEREVLSPLIRDDLAAIRASFNYLQRLSNGLKVFAADPRKAKDPNASTDIPQWWPDVRPLIRGALPIGISLEEDFPGALPLAAIDPTALSQVLYNLVQNAGEAIAGDTPLNQPPDHPPSRVRLSASLAPNPRGRILLTVSDNGPGMTPDVLRRCMDPFFSTKVRRISTGMGLPIVKGLIEQAGGSLAVRSEPGRGTTFTIELHDASSHVDTPPANHPEESPRPLRCRAAVTMTSPQARAYILWEIKSFGAEAIVHEATTPPTPTPPPDADLWIVEPSESMAQPIRDFLGANSHANNQDHTVESATNGAPRRHVIIHGSPIKSLAADSASGPIAGAITVTGAHTLPSKLRPYLDRALHDPTPS